MYLVHKMIKIIFVFTIIIANFTQVSSAKSIGIVLSNNEEFSQMTLAPVNLSKNSTSLEETQFKSIQTVIGRKESLLIQFDKIEQYFLAETDGYDGEYQPIMQRTLKETRKKLDKLPDEVTLNDLVNIVAKNLPSNKDVEKFLKRTIEESILPTDSDNVYWSGSRLGEYLSKWSVIPSISLLVMSRPDSGLGLDDNFELFFDALFPRLNEKQKIVYFHLVNPSVFNSGKTKQVSKIFSIVFSRKFDDKEPEFLKFLISLANHQQIGYGRYFNEYFVSGETPLNQIDREPDYETMRKTKETIAFLRQYLKKSILAGNINEFHRFISMFNNTGFILEFFRQISPIEKLFMFTGNNKSMAEYHKDIKWPKVNSYSPSTAPYKLWNDYDKVSMYRSNTLDYHLLEAIKGITDENVLKYPYAVANFINNLGRKYIGWRRENNPMDIGSLLEYEFSDNYFTKNNIDLLQFLNDFSEQPKVNKFSIGSFLKRISSMLPIKISH